MDNSIKYHVIYTGVWPLRFDLKILYMDVDIPQNQSNWSLACGVDWSITYVRFTHTHTHIYIHIYIYIYTLYIIYMYAYLIYGDSFYHNFSNENWNNRLVISAPRMGVWLWHFLLNLQICGVPHFNLLWLNLSAL